MSIPYLFWVFSSLSLIWWRLYKTGGTCKGPEGSFRRDRGLLSGTFQSHLFLPPCCAAECCQEGTRFWGAQKPSSLSSVGSAETVLYMCLVSKESVCFICWSCWRRKNNEILWLLTLVRTCGSFLLWRWWLRTQAFSQVDFALSSWVPLWV